MKKVLIALDYGISARKIAEQGYNLAKSMKAKVTLLHVVADETYYSGIDAGPFMGFYGYDFFNIDDKNTLMESSLNFLEKIKSHLKDPDIEIIAEKGDFSTVILDVATRNHTSIIVLGAHSKNWLVKTVMGSVTESVLSNSKIPMFIIPVKE
ncbi:universal stress protein [Flavobacterium sp. 25HG05S-40]|uniref:universal stress protein n=1 Tax=Flavobacterium sp. 25HG05S-40 TaxID=3458682 RepID=UPI0040448FE2